ncbi:MAG: condensation domain-containing protein, partial [Chloroflexota bacterium]
QGLVEGEAPLTPIQRWFLECELAEAHHWNQAILLEVRQPLERGVLEETVRQLLGHHDALRLRYERGEGGWRQWNSLPEEGVPFSWVELAGLEAAEQRAAIETHAAALQASLNLEAGPLMRLAYFDMGEGQAGRLLVVVHHLAIDGVSWRILLEDLETVYGHLAMGQPVQLPAKTTSFRRWAERLQEYAGSENLRQELDHWLAVAENGVAHLPLDRAGGSNLEKSQRSVRVSLTAQETETLLREVPATYGTEINDALLAALAQALARWTGCRAVLVELEGHGREDLFEDVDLSRTVGWFTAAFPVSLDLEDATGPGEALMTIKEQLRRVPHRGIGYGLLRYLSHDETIRQRLAALPWPEVSFNYLGQVDQALASDTAFRLAREGKGPERSPRGPRSQILSVSGSIVGGRLQMEWAYSENLHRRETIEGVAQDFVHALRLLIAHCQTSQAGGYTPSDFADVALNQDEVDALLKEISEALGDD